MHTRIGLVWCLSLCATLSQQHCVRAQEAIEPQQIGYAELAALGDQIESLEQLKDNAFLYKEGSEQVRQSADALPRGNLSFTVVVKRVTEQEVFLFVPDARETCIALKHREPPEFGNLRTVVYPGPLTTKLADILSKPMALRIGSEIDQQIAKGLRKGDLLILNGRLETIHLLLEIFNPRAIAVISNPTVSQVNPSDASKEYFYKY